MEEEEDDGGGVSCLGDSVARVGFSLVVEDEVLGISLVGVSMAGFVAAVC